MTGPLLLISLTMSYFHTGTRTIIGAEAFHFPVRDGKEWDHLAMVVRLDFLPRRHLAVAANSQSLISLIAYQLGYNALTSFQPRAPRAFVKVIGSSLTSN